MVNTGAGRFALGMSIALGLVLAASIASLTALRIAGAKQSITVKGLAEKPVTADQARWTLQVSGSDKNLEQAFVRMRANRDVAIKFFQERGFTPANVAAGRELFRTEYLTDKEGRSTSEIDHHIATQSFQVSSSDVKLIAKTLGEVVSLQEKGLPLEVDNPEFLVSGLEQIKMSLIAEATKNAHARANEFAKTGNAKVGAMKAATQGAFYILPAQGGASSDDYGGVYDKSTIEKTARVVVTVEYGLTTDGFF